MLLLLLLISAHGALSLGPAVGASAREERETERDRDREAHCELAAPKAGVHDASSSGDKVGLKVAVPVRFFFFGVVITSLGAIATS